MTSATTCCLQNFILSFIYRMFFIFIFACFIFIILRMFFKCMKILQKESSFTVGFFHPYCNAGGGGERVLWTAIKAIQDKYDHIQCVVYTGDVTASQSDILCKVKSQLNITFQREIKFIYLSKRYLVEAKLYPFFTLLFQSLASMILGFEALWKFVPDVYIDTMGYAFTVPLFKYLGCCKTACYTHYPTISTDMLEVVSKRNIAVNNKAFISRSPMLSRMKVIYYRAFAILYGIMGRCADVIMVNSSWTKGHILSLWKVPKRTILVYPPCDTIKFENIPLKRVKQSCRIVSIAQFRPEKDHPLQLESFQKFLMKIDAPDVAHLKLVVIGGCRSDEDFKRVAHLKQLSKHLNIEQNVEFLINLPFENLILEMQIADLALHSMWNEHFGIGVVECMSAGLVTIAHNSGGPKLDIVVEHNGKPTGYLACDTDSYADALYNAWKMSENEKTEMRQNARESARRFSVENFEVSFLDAVKNLL